MTIAVLSINKRVVVDEVFSSSVIRWIDIYNVDFAGVGVGKFGKGCEVVALDYKMIRSFGVI